MLLNREPPASTLTLFKAANTVSGMWSWIMAGEMSTSSKSMLSTQIAW